MSSTPRSNPVRATAVPASSARRSAASAVGPAAIAAVLYALWLAAFVHAGNSIWTFVKLGRFAARAGFGHGTGTGFDGQFYYCLARVPLHAQACLDRPGYRYSRIFYPLVTRAVALGQPKLIPYALLAVNMVSVVAATFALALWLRDRDLSPYLALIYALAPPLLTSVQRDLAEPLSYALIAGAVLWFDRGRMALAAVLFALGVLTREVVVLFPLAYALSFLQTRRPLPQDLVRAAGFFLATVAPYAMWKLYLTSWIGNSGLPSAALPTPLPFQGLVAHGWHANETLAAVTIIAPAMICGFVSIVSLRREIPSAVIALLLNILLNVVFLNAESYHDYFGAGRASLGVILAAIYCIPVVDRYVSGRRWWLTVSAVFWLVLTPFWFAVVPFWLLTGHGA